MGLTKGKHNNLQNKNNQLSCGRTPMLQHNIVIGVNKMWRQKET